MNKSDDRALAVPFVAAAVGSKLGHRLSIDWFEGDVRSTFPPTGAVLPMPRPPEGFFVDMDRACCH